MRNTNSRGIYYWGYTAPVVPDKVPDYTVPTKEAATYLAKLPVKCHATDNFSVDNMPLLIDKSNQGISNMEVYAPIHYTFHYRGMPIIKEIQNLEAITGYDEVVFVGFPLKTTGKAGDAAPMRAVALIY